MSTKDRFWGDLRAMLAAFVDTYEELEEDGQKPDQRRVQAARRLGTSEARLACMRSLT